MIVISHLALNEMLKLGDEIVDICLLLESDDAKIKDLVKQFLIELKNKGNNIVFNLIPKALNTWLIEYKSTDYKKFKIVMEELVSNIEKDKQIEGLIEKLFNKLKSTTDVNDWKCVTYCLSLLNYSEKNAYKLFEYFANIRENVIGDDEILKNLSTIIEKIKKSITDKDKITEIEMDDKMAQIIGKESLSNIKKTLKDVLAMHDYQFKK